jgi:hypothetical protein
MNEFRKRKVGGFADRKTAEKARRLWPRRSTPEALVSAIQQIHRVSSVSRSPRNASIALTNKRIVFAIFLLRVLQEFL